MYIYIYTHVYKRKFISRSATLWNFNRALELVESNTETAGPRSHTSAGNRWMPLLEIASLHSKQFLYCKVAK